MYLQTEGMYQTIATPPSTILHGVGCPSIILHGVGSIILHGVPSIILHGVGCNGRDISDQSHTSLHNTAWCWLQRQRWQATRRNYQISRPLTLLRTYCMVLLLRTYCMVRTTTTTTPCILHGQTNISDLSTFNNSPDWDEYILHGVYYYYYYFNDRDSTSHTYTSRRMAYLVARLALLRNCWRCSSSGCGSNTTSIASLGLTNQPLAQCG